MHAAMDALAVEAKAAAPAVGARQVIDYVLARVRRGIDDAKGKGATGTQMAYLDDFHTVASAHVEGLGDAVAAPAAVPVPPTVKAPSKRPPEAA
jgi:hypothetical protein